MCTLITFPRFPTAKPPPLVLICLSILLNCSRVSHIAVRFRLDTYSIVLEVAVGSDSRVEVYSVTLEILRGGVTLGDKVIGGGAVVKQRGNSPSQ